MSTNNELRRFPYPVRGLGVIAVFLFIGPPVQVCVEAFMKHSWAGGRRLLIEIVAVFQADAWPGILPGYSIFMPPVLIAGLWSAIGPAHGDGLTISASIGRMVAAGLGCELIYQAVIVAAGGPFMAGNVMIGLVQWIFSGWICWIVATGFRLDKPVER